MHFLKKKEKQNVGQWGLGTATVSCFDFLVLVCSQTARCSEELQKMSPKWY